MPAKILEQQTASNIVHALQTSLPELSASRLQELAKNVHEWIFAQFMGDAVSANRLAQSILANMMQDVVIDDARCAMHQAHLVFVNTVRSWGLTGPMYSLSTGIRNSGNQVKLIAAFCRQSKTVKIHYGRPPPPEAAAFTDWLFDVSVGRFQNLDSVESEAERNRIRGTIEKLRAMLKATLNGRLWLEGVEHFCWQADGTPCCSSPRAAQNKVGAVFQEVVSLIIDGRNVASDHDWFKTVHAAKAFTFGLGAHMFFGRALRQVCPLSEADTDAALAESAEDDRATMFAKRLKRGVKRLTDPVVVQRLMTMMATTSELEAFTYVLIGECKDERLKSVSNPEGKQSVLRRMIENNRELLVRVQSSYARLVVDPSGSGMDMLWRHVREGDGLDKSAKIRVARGSAVRGSGQFNARLYEHYAAFPFDWIMFQEKDAARQDAIGERFLDKPLCDCKPFVLSPCAAKTRRQI